MGAQTHDPKEVLARRIYTRGFTKDGKLADQDELKGNLPNGTSMGTLEEITEQIKRLYTDTAHFLVTNLPSYRLKLYGRSTQEKKDNTVTKTFQNILFFAHPIPYDVFIKLNLKAQTRILRFPKIREKAITLL